jgi:uncharacterized protein YdeI (YjbR/CyaY-like superfamily)
MGSCLRVAATRPVPTDLQRALNAEPDALAYFGTLHSHNRYAILYRVQDARKPETRAKRIADFVRMLAHRETLRGRQTPGGSPIVGLLTSITG